MAGPLQVVVGADALAADVDHGPRRGEEGTAALAVTERGEPAPHRARCRRRDASRPSARRARAPRPARGRVPEAITPSTCVGARQGRGSQDEVDLPAQAAAGDQHQAVHPLGEEVEELHRDAAAERVPDERDPLDAEVVEQVAQGRGVRAERVVAGGLADSPCPNRSGTITRWSSSIRSTRCDHCRCDPRIPWMNSTTGPEPLST